MKKRGQVLVVGPSFVDSIYSGLPSMPELGKEVYGKHHTLTAGGCLITAIGVARLGVPVVVATAIGDDLFGEFLENRLQIEGVSNSAVVRMEGKPTNSTTAMVYDNDRAFVSYSGAELKESELVNAWHTKIDRVFPQIKHMHLSLREDPGLSQLLRSAKEHCVQVSLVSGWDGVEYYADQPELLKEILQHTDLFFCNELEAGHFSGAHRIEDALAFFLDFHCHPVITLGSKGAMTVDDQGNLIKVNALEVDFLDATGAGDSFVAGFISGRMLGFEWGKALRLGTVCGSLSTTALGGTEAFPASLEVALGYFSTQEDDEQ